MNLIEQPLALTQEEDFIAHLFSLSLGEAGHSKAAQQLLAGAEERLKSSGLASLHSMRALSAAPEASSSAIDSAANGTHAVANGTSASPRSAKEDAEVAAALVARLRFRRFLQQVSLHQSDLSQHNTITTPFTRPLRDSTINILQNTPQTFVKCNSTF